MAADVGTILQVELLQRRFMRGMVKDRSTAKDQQVCPSKTLLNYGPQLTDILILGQIGAADVRAAAIRVNFLSHQLQLFAPPGYKAYFRAVTGKI